MMAAWETNCYKIFGVGSFSLDFDDANAFVNSQWAHACKGCAVAYGAYRVAMAIFWISILVSYLTANVYWLLPASVGSRWFLFLTNWSLIVVTADATLQAISWITNRFQKTEYTGKNSMITFGMKMQWVIFNIALGSGTISSLVDGIYILGTMDNPDYRGFVIYIISSVYLLVNLFIVGIPIRFFHFLHTTLFLLVFLLTSAIKQYTDGAVVYGFINWSSPLAVGLIVGLAVFGVMAVWSLFVLLYLIRMRMTGGHKRGLASYATPYNPYADLVG